MNKGVCFIDKDKDLVKEIENYQYEHKLKSFVDAVRALCKSGLSLTEAVEKMK